MRRGRVRERERERQIESGRQRENIVRTEDIETII
jgi:hypothetical protein